MAAQSNQGHSAWLGGEAHVRLHDGYSIWNRLMSNKQGVVLALVFIAGAALGGGAAVLACARKSSEHRRGSEVKRGGLDGDG